jgi:CubicO group peptidase (beta-lactamase class C family)
MTVDRGEDPVGSWLASRAESGVTPGGTWWIEGPGVLSHGAAGRAALEPAPEPADETVRYDLASLTKPLCTALLAALLEQDGRLSLDAPVAELVDQLDGSPYASASLLDLGSHRARLPAWRPLYLTAASLEGGLRAIASTPPVETEEAGVYSDLGYIVLGAVLQRISGASLEHLFRERIAGPLGLSNLGFVAGASRLTAAAPTERGNAFERGLAGDEGGGFPWRTGVIRGEVHDVNAHALGGVAGHAGLFGTVRDVATVAREILNPQVLDLRAQARERLLLPSHPGADRTFGFVLARASEAARGVLPDDAPGHTGFTGTSLWLDPERNAFYVLLTNRVHPRVASDPFQPERLAFHRLARGLEAPPRGSS